MDEKSSIFLLTFFSFALIHAGRKSFSAIKSDLIESEWMVSSFYKKDQQTEMCGLLDTLFLAFYSLGLYASGIIGDIYNLKHVISIGMILSALMCILFGVGGLMGEHSLSYYAIVWSLHGLVQSSGWPSNVAVMGNWFSKSERGAIFGIWSGNGSFGNIIGTTVVAAVFGIPQLSHQWEISLILIAILLLFHAFIIHFFLHPSPDDVKQKEKIYPKDCISSKIWVDQTLNEEVDQTELKFHSSTKCTNNSKECENSSQNYTTNFKECENNSKECANLVKECETLSNECLIETLSYSYVAPSYIEDEISLSTDGKLPLLCMMDVPVSTSQSISFFSAWAIPGVMPYAASFACLKSVNYALFFWLPFYLSNEIHMSESEANYFSMLFDVGQIAGGFVGGYISDRLGVRSPVVTSMTLIACVVIQFLRVRSYLFIGAALTLGGFFMGGPSNLIASAISADLGTHPSLAGNSKALATVTGIIDGTGSLGAAVSQYVVGYLAQCHVEPIGCSKEDSTCRTICSWDSVFLLFFYGAIGSVLCLLPLVRNELQWCKRK